MLLLEMELPFIFVEKFHLFKEFEYLLSRESLDCTLEVRSTARDWKASITKVNSIQLDFFI